MRKQALSRLRMIDNSVYFSITILFSRFLGLANHGQVCLRFKLFALAIEHFHGFA